MSPPSGRSILSKISTALQHVNWKQVNQSIADGAGNTIGTVFIYSLVVIGIFLWYRRSKKPGVDSSRSSTGGNGQSDALSNALSFSKVGVVTREATHMVGNGTDATSSSSSTAAWV